MNIDYAAEAARFASACDEIRVRELAQALGVSPESLRALGVGWAIRAELQRLRCGGHGWNDDYPAGAFTFPEHEGAGHVVGLSLRALDGRKGCPAGAGRGLVVPVGLARRAGARLLVEGASDVAAAATLGLAAIGRPSNRGGASEVAELLRDQDVLVVGERDEDPARPDRGWPGRDGALHVAGALAHNWRKPVRWTLPPDGSKDVRAWLLARVEAGLNVDDRTACQAAGEELIAALVAAQQQELPPLCVPLVPERYGRHIATLAVAAVGEPFDSTAVIHTGRLRIAEAEDRSAWAAEAAQAAAQKAPWLGGGDDGECARLIGELLDAAVCGAVARVTSGPDEEEEERATVAERIVRLAEGQYRLGVSEEGEPFAVVRDGPNIALSLRGSADALRARLARDYRRIYDATPSGSALADALTVLTGEAQDCAPEPVALRVARYGAGVVIDLGDAAGRAIVVTNEGWTVVDRSPVLFRRTALTGEWPTPERGGSIDDLWEHLAAAPADRPLLAGWLAHALIPDEPHAILLIGGPQGSGKTTTAERLAMLIDPGGAPTRTAPRETRQWAIVAAGSLVVALDNVSHIPDWLSDALCRAATGDGWVDRALYTDADLTVLRFQRVVALTSIDPGALKGDLGDRIVLVDFERIPRSARRRKRELNAAFEAARPKLLGAVLDLVVEVLSRRDALPNQSLPRMADYGTVLAALDQARGTDGLTRYLQQARRVAEDVVEGDLVAAAVAIWARGAAPWIGTAEELLDAITPEKPPRGWPGTPRALAGLLRRAAPALSLLGVVVVPPAPNDRPRNWRVSVADPDPPDPAPSDGSDGPMDPTDARNNIPYSGGAAAQHGGHPDVPAEDGWPNFSVPDDEPDPTVGTVGPSEPAPATPAESFHSPTVAPTVGESSANTDGPIDGPAGSAAIPCDDPDDADGQVGPPDKRRKKPPGEPVAPDRCGSALGRLRAGPGVQSHLALGQVPPPTTAPVQLPIATASAAQSLERAEAALRLVITGGLPQSDVDEAFATVEQLKDRATAVAVATAARAEREAGP